MNPFRLLAYQKICADYYRVPQWEDVRVKSWNIDGLPLDMTATWNTQIMQDFTNNYLRINYRPWKKDLLTISQTQFQGAEFLSNNFSVDKFPTTQTSDYSSFVATTAGDSGKQGTLYAEANVKGQQLNIANLRAAFALDKLYRTMASAAVS